ncbi:Vitellogenin receptor [Trachymyrmex cornetzi]|uniref:Vitellogenin receptor n=1 Tax=Trachymyrmex cornetzi TaxID=471704 RepID=A0A195ECQ1_9HYME|nr:Vitellogenin receptor [Trachymyrmex cornetzi]
MNAMMNIENCDIKMDFDGTRTTLMEATSTGHVDTVSCLITHRIDVNTRSASCNTPLIYGCASGYKEIVRILLDSGADVEDHNEDGHTSLMEAASAGHVDIVSLLIAHGANINAQSTSSDTPLIYGCAGGHEEVVRILIDFGANVEFCNETGCTPLIKAASAGNVDIVSLLIAHGADVNARSASCNTPLIYGCAGGHEEVVRILLDSGADVEDHNEDGHTPLMEAASAGHVDIVSLLIIHGANINTLSTSNNTPLMYGCINGHEEVVHILLCRGANFEDYNENGRTPLMEAASTGHVNIVSLLIAYGAYINAQSTSSDTPLIYGCAGGHEEVVRILIDFGANVEFYNKIGCTPLIEAASAGNVNIVSLLIAHGADVNARSASCNTPLIYGCAGGHEEVVRILLDSGADVEDHNEDGHTPLMEAASAGHVDIVSLLITHGADINTLSTSNNTPLMYGCVNGHEEIVRILLDWGANVEDYNENGRTPLMEAASTGHVNIVSLLIAHGADINAQSTSNDTALIYGCAGGHEEVVRILIDFGANVEFCNEIGCTRLIKAANVLNVDIVSLLIAYVNARSASCKTPLIYGFAGGHGGVVCVLLDVGADVEDHNENGQGRRLRIVPNVVFAKIGKLEHSLTCSTYEYKCSTNDTCIPKAMFCDTIMDCPDGSDEYDGCVEDLICTKNNFRCNDGRCIFREWVCDGRNDCSDGSDESNCSINNCKTKNFQYLCKNQLCIPLKLVCNGKDDCGDKSDEIGCTSSCPSSVKCDYECKPTPKGNMCLCKPGYKLQNDSHTCIDIDECQTYGICDQECVNSPGSYSCKCQTDYFLQEDKKTCKASGYAKILFSTKNEIFGMYLAEINKFFTELKFSSHLASIAVNDEHIYFSNLKDNHEVISSNIPDSKDIVTVGLSRISAMAIDWITENLYFTDKINHHIGVCKISETYTTCTVLIDDIDQPMGIALLPTRGKMYWCDWGSNPHIAVAGMDGKNIRVFVSENIKAPRSLTIDYQADRLYWVDFKLRKIESIRLDGTDRRFVLHNIIYNPFSLAVFENKLYWVDMKSNAIQSCNKFTGKDRNILHRSLHPYNVYIEHPALKPKINNPCLSNPCSELCMLNQENGYTCACPLDKELNVDNHTCQEVTKKQHLLLSDRYKLIDYYDGMIGKPKENFKFKLLSVFGYLQNMASDPITELFDNSVVKRIDPVTDTVETIISLKSHDDYSGLAFDYISNNLYILNVHNRSIEVYNIKTLAMTIFYFKDHVPYYITLVPEESKMYVAFQKKSSLKSLETKYFVYEMQMNGLGERKLLMENLTGSKISMCYHRDSKTLFVNDHWSILLHSAAGTHKFRNNLTIPTSLTIMGNNIYWTEGDGWSENKKLYSTNVKDTFDLSHKNILVFDMILEVSFMVTLSKDVKPDHDCQKNNGNCSHVCLLSSNATFICACPPGMGLSDDNRTCIISECLANEFKCSEHSVCISKKNVCDGIEHCPNGEDETMGNCYEKKKCEEDHFTCTNGECIDIEDRCNGHYDCIDLSDEMNCRRPQCREGKDNTRGHPGNVIEYSLIIIFNIVKICKLHCIYSLYLFIVFIHNTNKFFLGKFQCHSGSISCIPEMLVCNKIVSSIYIILYSFNSVAVFITLLFYVILFVFKFDCQDGSDETPEACKSITQCLDEQFRCSNGHCISASLKCDGFHDCLDNSDEVLCPYSLNNCSKNEYQCLDINLCLPKQVRCDGVFDCPKFDDEYDCVGCWNDEFSCDKTKCIPKSWVCDKKNDCDDFSDEKDCVDGKKPINFTITESTKCNEFKCTIGTCLPYLKVCDGIQDCPDGSDENGKCQTACSLYTNCEYQCYKTPKGDVCGCPDGYGLNADEVCEDINECENDVCSQYCRNLEGSFECLCNDHHKIDMADGVSCKAIGSPMEFITITDNDIRKISYNLRSIDVIYSLLDSSINGFDVNAIHDSVYWSNSEFGTIKKLKIGTKEIFTITTEHPQALSIDWVTDNVYVNDNGRLNTIQVCNFEKQRCAPLVEIEDKAKVGSLLVDSFNRWLFWSQITLQMDKPFSKICRTDMMGADMKIIDSDVGFVSGMTIDYVKSKLYWLNNFNNVIKLSNFDGSQRSTFLRMNMHHPLSINIYERSLYWLTGMNGQVRHCKLYGDKLCETLNINTNNVHRHFAILHISRQPVRCIHRIRFQNPWFNQRDEVELTLDSTIEDVSPEQHEHVNPLDDEFVSMKIT